MLALAATQTWTEFAHDDLGFFFSGKGPLLSFCRIRRITMQSRWVVVACLGILVLSGRVLAEFFDGYVDDNGGCPVWNDPSDLVLIDPINHLLGLNRTAYRPRETTHSAAGGTIYLSLERWNPSGVRWGA